MIDRLREDRDAALKRRDNTTVQVLRMVLADIHNREIALGRDLEEEEVVGALRKAVKLRLEAAEQFEEGGRADRAAQERAEIEVLGPYLPQMLEGEELSRAIDEVIAETRAASRADMGKVMGLLMQRYQGRIDGKTANTEVGERLADPGQNP